jgi:hypothetical protein
VQFQNGAYEVCFRRLPPGFPLVPQDFKHYRLTFRIVLEISQSLISGRSPYPALKRSININARMQDAPEKTEVKKL